MSKFGKDGSFNANVFRANFKNVIAKRSDLVELSGQRMVAPAPGGGGALVEVTNYAGTVVGQVTASKLLVPYNAANVDGSQVPIGVLRDDVTMDSDNDGSSCVVITGGTLFQDLLIGLDNNAIGLLGGRKLSEGGQNLIKIG